MAKPRKKAGTGETADFLPDETGGSLGRHINHDPQNRDYPARGVLFGDDAPLQTRIWEIPRHMPWNQGHTSSCTMHAASGLLHSEPFSTTLTPTALESYDTFNERVEGYERSKEHDPWTGTNYDGTSTDAPLKLFRLEGHIREWRWCFGLDDVLRTLSNYAPVVIGVSWHADMFLPGPDGNIKPTGRVVGGHAVMLYANVVGIERVFGINSWGVWGDQGGHFNLDYTDLETLLEDRGEAATIVL